MRNHPVQLQSQQKSKTATVGYGTTSDPIWNCSFDSLCAAVKLATQNLGAQSKWIKPGVPSRVARADLVEVEAQGTWRGCVTERITIKAEIGSATYNKCDRRKTKMTRQRSRRSSGEVEPPNSVETGPRT